MRSPRGLRARLEAPGRRTVTYCGSGISASALLFAVPRAGFGDAALYDASWEERGRDPQRAVARG
jgi:thiosulfate/3-mercaptopyruvate sulfurtransferase